MEVIIVFLCIQKYLKCFLVKQHQADYFQAGIGGSIDEIQDASAGICRFSISNQTVISHPLAALRLDHWFTTPHDGSCHTGSMFQIFIGGINNCIHRFRGNIRLPI